MITLYRSSIRSAAEYASPVFYYALPAYLRSLSTYLVSQNQSELVLSGMALLMDQSRTLPKRGNSESCGGNNVRARLGTFQLNWPEPLFSSGQNGTMENYLINNIERIQR